MGPARIVDLTQIHRGTVGINHQGEGIVRKLGEPRGHLTFLCFETAILSSVGQPLEIIPTVTILVERLVDGSVLHFGLHNQSQ